MKFASTESEGGFLLVSDLSDTSNDATSVTFDPADSSFTVSDLTNLTAVYDVVDGNCGGGALRWSITTTEGNVFVYYGQPPSFTDCSGAWTGGVPPPKRIRTSRPPSPDRSARLTSSVPRFAAAGC